MILSIIRKEIQVTLKEKGTFFWLIGLPILFIMMFASVFGHSLDSITIRYYDADNSKASQQFVETLKSIKGFDLKADSTLTLDEQVQKIKDGKNTSLLVIPKGYGDSVQSGKNAQLDFYRDATADTAVAPVLAVLNNVSNNIREQKLQGTLKALGKNDAEVREALAPPLELKEIKENAAKTDMITQVVPGYTVMFVFFILITMVRNFIKDKESGMVSRLRSTPLKSYQYLIGMWVPNIITVLIQCAVLLLFGNLVYGLNLGDPLSIILIVICLAICATGIGLAMSMLVHSENQGVAFTQIITMGGAVVGGLWFPMDFMPAWAQAIGRFTPQYWAQHEFQDVMIRGAHFTDIVPALLVLLAYGALGLLIATLRFKKFIQSATS